MQRRRAAPTTTTTTTTSLQSKGSSGRSKQRQPIQTILSLEKVLMVILMITAILIGIVTYFHEIEEEEEGILVIHDKSKQLLQSAVVAAVGGDDVTALQAVDADLKQKSSSVSDIINTDTDITKYHLIFSTGCSPFQDWQSYIFFFHAWQSGQEGNVTRIASCSNANDASTLRQLHDTTIKVMSDRFQLHITPDFSHTAIPGRNYKYANKPFGVLHFLKNVLHYHDHEGEGEQEGSNNNNKHDDTIIMLLDPDQLIIRPFTNDFSESNEVWRPTKSKLPIKTKVEHGSPFGQQYGFGLQWKTKVNATYVTNDASTRIETMDMDEAKGHYVLGPPYIATARDMFAISQKWTEYLPRVHDNYPHLLAEMFAYCLAAAHLNLPHRVAHSFMVSDTGSGGEGWKLVQKMTDNQVCNPPPELNPHVLHYCHNYNLGKWFIGKYRLRKDFISCDAPLLKEPPTDIVNYHYKIAPDGSRTEIGAQGSQRNAYMLCSLLPRLNQAAIFFKEHHCDAGQGNFNKTYIFHDSDEGM